MGRFVLRGLLLWGAFVGFAHGFASLASFDGESCGAHHRHHHHRHHAPESAAPAVDAAEVPR